MTTDFYSLSPELQDYFKAKYNTGEDVEMLKEMFGEDALSPDPTFETYDEIKKSKLQVSDNIKNKTELLAKIATIIEKYYGGFGTSHDSFTITMFNEDWYDVTHVPAEMNPIKLFSFKRENYARKFIENCSELLDEFFGVVRQKPEEAPEENEEEN